MLLKELKEAFRIYDKDEEGWVKMFLFRNYYQGKLFSFISTNSLKEILKELDSQLSDEELEGIIEEVDTDGSGTLDFDGKEKLPARISVFLPNYINVKFPLSFLATVNTKIICRKKHFS